jgi:hypothetical protein
MIYLSAVLFVVACLGGVLFAADRAIKRMDPEGWPRWLTSRAMVDAL